MLQPNSKHRALCHDIGHPRPCLHSRPARGTPHHPHPRPCQHSRPARGTPHHPHPRPCLHSRPAKGTPHHQFTLACSHISLVKQLQEPPHGTSPLYPTPYTRQYTQHHTTPYTRPLYPTLYTRQYTQHSSVQYVGTRGRDSRTGTHARHSTCPPQSLTGACPVAPALQPQHPTPRAYPVACQCPHQPGRQPGR